MENILYKCGHTAEKKFTNFGIPTKCPECTKQYRDARSKIASENAKLLGFPVLKGSPNQTKWAETIRASFLKRLKNIKVVPGDLPGFFIYKSLSKAKRDSIPNYILAHDSTSFFTKEETKEKLISDIKTAMNQADSKWWIENKDERLAIFLYKDMVGIKYELATINFDTQRYCIILVYPPKLGDIVFLDKVKGIVTEVSPNEIIIRNNNEIKKLNLSSSAYITKLIRKENIMGILEL